MGRMKLGGKIGAILCSRPATSDSALLLSGKHIQHRLLTWMTSQRHPWVKSHAAAAAPRVAPSSSRLLSDPDLGGAAVGSGRRGRDLAAAHSLAAPVRIPSQKSLNHRLLPTPSLIFAASRTPALPRPLSVAGGAQPFTSAATTAAAGIMVWWRLKFEPTEQPLWRESEILHAGVSTTTMLVEIRKYVEQKSGAGVGDEAQLRDEFAKLFGEKGRKMDVELLLAMHKLICGESKPELGVAGCLRDEDVYTTTISLKEHFYISHAAVPEELRNLVDDINFLLEHVDSSDISAMFKVAALFYARFIWRIHPFGDKNGKVGMLMVSVMLKETLGFYMRWPDPWPDDHHQRISPEHAILLWCLENTSFASKSPSDLCAWMIESAWMDCRLELDKARS